MKRLLIIALIPAAIAFGCFVMTRLDGFIEANRGGRLTLRVGAESQSLLDAAASAMDRCGGTELFFTVGRAERLLEKLEEAQLDLLLLDEDTPLQDAWRFEQMSFTHERSGEKRRFLGGSLECLDDKHRVRVLWKRDTVSAARERLISAIETEHCRLKTGYADYLD